MQTSGRPTAGLSAHTERAYESDWHLFSRWCSARKIRPLQSASEKVAEYLEFCAQTQASFATIRRRLAAIQFTKQRHGRPSPADDWLVRNTMRILRKELAGAPRRKKPLLLDDIRRMLERCGSDLCGLRDRAILLTGFCAALRRSELSALSLEHLERANEGLVLWVKRKQSKKLKPSAVALPFGKHAETCPVRALDAWIQAAQIREGRVFRAINKAGVVSPVGLSDKSIADLVKYYAETIGKPGAAISAHSLRTGFAVSAAKAGASLSQIRNQTGHASLEALRQYTGALGIFEDHALKKLDL